MHRPALLVIAHGSRDPRHARAVHALVARVRALRPGLPVGTGFLDFSLPSVPGMLASWAAQGVREIVAQPLLLNHAFHAKVDIPAVLRRAPARLHIRQADVLGPSPLLVAALERRLYEAGLTPADKASTGVVLAAAGSTDPAAIKVTAGVARDWQRSGWCAVRPAFAAGAATRTPPPPEGRERYPHPLPEELPHCFEGRERYPQTCLKVPGTAEAVRRLRAAGVARIAVARYVLAPGHLPDRIARDAADADVLAEVLGAAPEVARLVLRRYDAACGTAAGAPPIGAPTVGEPAWPSSDADQLIS